MTLVHEIIYNTSYVSSVTANLNANTPIGIIGIAEGATFPINTITRIQTEDDVDSIGSETDNTITPEVEILQAYGCNNIYVIRVDKGVDAPTTQTNIIGAEGVTNTGIYLFQEVFSLYKENLDFILIPGYDADAVVAAALSVAAKSGSMVAMDHPTGSTVANITTTRGTATGLGTKNPLLLTFAPKVKDVDDNIESLATHTVGVIARKTQDKGFGYTSSNTPFIGIDSIESGFTLSYTDDTASNQVLERLGVMSVNLNSDGYVAWGNRNSLWVTDTTETIDTYYVTQRIKQEMDSQIQHITQKFIDEPANFSTAQLLQSALNKLISQNMVIGNLRSGSRAAFNSAKSDYCQRKLVYDFQIGYNLPTELINLNTTYTINI